jgi:hypothetical protein
VGYARPFWTAFLQCLPKRGPRGVRLVTSDAHEGAESPAPQSAIRLVGAILLEHDDEWAVAERRFFTAPWSNSGKACANHTT